MKDIVDKIQPPAKQLVEVMGKRVTDISVHSQQTFLVFVFKFIVFKFIEHTTTIRGREQD